jgi:hypothetical protein
MPEEFLEFYGLACTGKETPKFLRVFSAGEIQTDFPGVSDEVALVRALKFLVERFVFFGLDDKEIVGMLGYSALDCPWWDSPSKDAKGMTFGEAMLASVRMKNKIRHARKRPYTMKVLRALSANGDWMTAQAISRKLRSVPIRDIMDAIERLGPQIESRPTKREYAGKPIIEYRIRKQC